MIREMTEDQFAQQFFDEFAELECGRHYDRNDPQHVEWVRHRIAEFFFRGAHFYAYCIDDQTPVGFIAVLIDKGLRGARCFGQYTEILVFGVGQEHRGNGYGRALLDHAEAASIEAGAYCIYVSTYAGADDSMTFYIEHGFVPVALHPDVHGPGDQGMVYLRKILKRQSDE